MPTTTTVSETFTTDNSSTTTSATITPLNPVALIDLILADVNAVLPNFNGLVSSYRLLVGAAEEIRRTRDVCPDVFERAVRRFDNAGTLIDVLLELLCCKIVFSSELLKVTCGPVDLVRYLLTCLDGEDTPCRSAESVVGLAALKKLQDSFCCEHYCLPDRPVVCPGPPVPPSPKPKPPTTTTSVSDNDIAQVVETEILTNPGQSGIIMNTNPPPNSVSAGNLSVSPEEGAHELALQESGSHRETHTDITPEEQKPAAETISHLRLRHIAKKADSMRSGKDRTKK